MAKLIFHRNHLETDNRYVCSKKQLKEILGRKAKHTYKQDTPLLGDGEHIDTTSYKVIRNEGAISIGCMTFTAREVALVKKWLAGKKVNNKWRYTEEEQ